MTFELLMARSDLQQRAERMFWTHAPSVNPTTQYLRRASLMQHWPAIGANAGLLVVTEAVFDDGRYFDLSADDGRHGVPTAVIEAIDECGDVVDLIGWPIDAPSGFRTMFGGLPMLGERAVHDPSSYWLGKALDVHETPFAWIKADCIGVVPIDLTASVRILADAPGQICCRDKAHAFALRAAMQAIVAAPIKRIVVPIEAVP